MVSKKLQILEEINNAEDTLARTQLLAEAYPYVQDLVGDILEKVAEVKAIVRGADEVMPKGQTKIQESLEEPDLLGYKLGSLMGE